jgi:hypothetical protein
MSDPTTRYDRVVLTVVFRNEAPWAAREPATYRSVHIKLNEEQQRALAVQGNTGPCSDRVDYEKIAHCFLEAEHG